MYMHTGQSQNYNKTYKTKVKGKKVKQVNNQKHGTIKKRKRGIGDGY